MAQHSLMDSSFAFSIFASAKRRGFYNERAVLLLLFIFQSLGGNLVRAASERGHQRIKTSLKK